MKNIATDAVINGVRLKEQEAPPSAPAAGYKVLFAKPDGIYAIGNSGVASLVGGGSLYNYARGMPYTVQGNASWLYTDPANVLTDGDTGGQNPADGRFIGWYNSGGIITINFDFGGDVGISKVGVACYVDYNQTHYVPENGMIVAGSTNLTDWYNFDLTFINSMFMKGNAYTLNALLPGPGSYRYWAISLLCNTADGGDTVISELELWG